MAKQQSSQLVYDTNQIPARTSHVMASCTGDGWYSKSLSSIASIMFTGWVRPWYLYGKRYIRIAAAAATTEIKITAW